MKLTSSSSSLYMKYKRITHETKRYMDHHMLHLVSRNTFTLLFFLHPHLRPTQEILLSLTAASQHNAEHRQGSQKIPELTLNLVTILHHFPLGLCQAKRNPIPTQVVLDPHSTLPMQESCPPKNAIYSSIFLNIVFCLYAPTGTQVSQSHYGTLINIHHGYPVGVLSTHRCV